MDIESELKYQKILLNACENLFHKPLAVVARFGFARATLRHACRHVSNIPPLLRQIAPENPFDAFLP